MVVDHAAHVGRDPVLVAPVERFERAVVPGANARDKIQIIDLMIRWPTDDCQGRHDFPYPVALLVAPPGRFMRSGRPAATGEL
ncbi:MAG TPA: hypothetical protein VMY78_06325 [Solirubrobacteraceae bacterium]|nr:hypothetical protein [Solirubrobacteraceae bacterium]